MVMSSKCGGTAGWEALEMLESHQPPYDIGHRSEPHRALGASLA